MGADTEPQHPDWASEKHSNNQDSDHANDEEQELPPTTTAGPVQDAEKQQPNPAPQQEGPPNGGTMAWLQVLGSWMLFFNTWGTLNTFGVYQTYYESGDLYTASSSDISWIGSVQAFLVLLIGAFVGPIYDRGYFRSLLVFGTFMIVFGHMMLSLCTEFWQCLLAQGFVIGIGGEFCQKVKS